jgi:hypothetical protein
VKKKTTNRKPGTNAADKDAQLRRFKDMALEVGADESPGALDRAFGRLDMKKKDTRQPAKRKAKAK